MICERRQGVCFCVDTIVCRSFGIPVGGFRVVAECPIQAWTANKLQLSSPQLDLDQALFSHI
jgi:hypothetical protein